MKLSELLELGGDILTGDTYSYKGCSYKYLPGKCNVSANVNIIELIKRKNTGTKPTYTGPMEITYGDGTVVTTPFIDELDWDLDSFSPAEEIAYWRPTLDIYPIKPGDKYSAHGFDLICHNYDPIDNMVTGYNPDSSKKFSLTTHISYITIDRRSPREIEVDNLMTKWGHEPGDILVKMIINQMLDEGYTKPD